MFKIAVFSSVFLFIIPFGAFLASRNSKIRAAAFVGMLSFTCYMVLIHIAPIPEWRGTARGYALSMVDIFAGIVFLSIYWDKRIKEKFFFPPGSWTYFIYYLFTIISVTNAVYLNQWGFEIAKMFWMYIFFVASYNFILAHKNLWLIMYTICGIVFVMFLVGFYQKYIKGGTLQIPSTMPHQNSLSLYIEIFGSLIIGVILNEKLNRMRMVVLLVGFFSTLLLSIFTYSRGGLFCYMASIALIAFASITLNRVTAQKVGLIVVGILGGAMLLAYAAPRIIQRFQLAPEASKNSRIYLAYAALRMAKEYRFGVGANNFGGHSGPTGGYALELYENTKLTEESGPEGAIVETIYLLVAAECGWVTLWTLVLWFLYYYVLVIILIFYLRHCPCFGVVIGIFGGLSANYFQSLIEWSLKQYGNFYQIMFIFALIGALWTRRKELKKRKIK